MRVYRWRGWLALVAASALLLAACAGGSGSAGGAPTATGSGGSTTANGTPPGGAGATPTTNAVTTPGAQAGALDVCSQTPDVKAQLPATIPAYPGAQLRFGRSSSGNGFFGLCSSGSVSAISQFYVAQLGNKGWQQVQSTANGSSEQVSGKTGSGTVIITIQPDPQIRGQTEIIILAGGA